MSLSFEESLKNNENNIATTEIIPQNDGVAMASMDDVSIASPSIMTLDETYGVAAYSGDDGNWQQHSGYTYYSTFSDDNISNVDDEKNIILNRKQFNITQEQNSQYIPFEMPRYYDGYDLVKATLSIHYETSSGGHGATKPINVSYNAEKIRFAWLVDAGATVDVGKLKFEIHAYGTVIGNDGKQLGYIWKSKPNENLNVLQSICDCEDVINQIDDSWLQDLVTDVARAVASELAGIEVGEQVAAAEDAAARAEEYAKSAKASVESALNGYATEEYVDDAVASVDVTDQLEDYALKTYVDDAVAGVDVSEQLNDYALKTDLDSYYTSEQTDSKISDAIASADISSKLNDYYKKTETYSKSEVDTALGNVSVDLSDYYTKGEVEAKVTGIETNKGDIANINSKIEEINQDIANLEESSRVSYEATYEDIEMEDGTVQENMFTLWEVQGAEGESTTKTIKSRFKIAGGGGSVASSTPKIEYVTKSPYVVTEKDKAIIYYNFLDTDSSGDNVPEATAVWKVGKTMTTMQEIKKETIYVGEDLSFDVTDYLSVGKQLVVVEVTDPLGGYTSKTWSVKKVDVRLEVKFDDTQTNRIGNTVDITYIPHGDIEEKYVHFVLDDKLLKTVQVKSSGDSKVEKIPAQEHGAHLLKVYMTAEIDNNPITTEPIFRDIIWYDENSTIPVIGTRYQDFTAKQYDTTNIEYTVYDPSTGNPNVEIAVNGEVVLSQKLTENTDVYPFKAQEVGEYIITITCGETTKTLKANIKDLGISISPVAEGWIFDFNPVGKSNKDENDREWTDGSVSMSVSDNFDWVNGGYQIDENGDPYFCVKAGTTATINYSLFGNDAKVNGKEFKVIFKTTNIKNRNTSFISCMNNGIGLDMKVENANIYSSDNSLYSPYCEEDIIEFDFNIYAYDGSKTFEENILEDKVPIVLTFEDGVPNRPMTYVDTTSFWQSSPQPITIGSENCDTYIYRMRVYEKGLSDEDILKNFIADARNAEEMIDRHQRNQIYDENGLLTPEILAEKCPDLRIIMIDAPQFTKDKDEKIDNTIIRMIYRNGDSVLDNWVCNGAKHSGQGTSSNEYGYAGRNIDLIMDGDDALFTLGDGKTTSKTITLTRDSVPTDYLNIKVNIASSENQNNAQMARRYNMYNPFKRFAKFKDSKVKDCMEFYNCVVFIKERGDDEHREFADDNYHFYGIGNVGDSKKTDDTRVNDKNDPKECIIEIADYNLPLSEFPTGNNDELCRPEDWKAGNTAYDLLYAEYKYKDGKFKSFGSTTYEFRYEMKGITEEQREVNINAWRDLYKFIVTSTNEEFYRKLKEYFVVDSALYYYLFTERYTMVDNRAKNSFWHYGKVYISTSEAQTLGDDAKGYIIDDVQAAIRDGYRWDLTFGYDFDTSLGIDNTGKLILTYGKEDTDYYIDEDPSSGYIYRAAKSTFFCRLRDLFKSEMQTKFVEWENAWNATSLINQWDRAQSEFPEELWRKDFIRKYFRTYKGISIDNSIAGASVTRFFVTMMNGRKKYQRRMIERNQEMYMATKYFGTTATQDQIMLRFNNPESYVVKPDFTLYITPYSDMYIGVKFGNTAPPPPIRAKAGVEYTIPYSIAAETGDITLIYGASFIQAIGDLSKCYIGDNDFSKATRLQRLTIGNSTVEGYKNNFMEQITLGNNKMLEYLDIRNVRGLNSVIDLSNCHNVSTLYAEGTNATGVSFANGGRLEKAHLPNTITSLSMSNLNYLKAEDFNVFGYDNNDKLFICNTYDNLQTLVVENTPIINTYNIVNSSPKLNILRLIGMNWDRSYNIQNSAILDRALLMRGKNNSGGEQSQSVLTGYFHAATIKQKQLDNYRKVWSDLEISYDTKIDQYPVIFKNANGDILETQYVDKGQRAIDPTKRADNPLSPTISSTVSHQFAFDNWKQEGSDMYFDFNTQVFDEIVLVAHYTESLREYTIKYVSKGVVMQESIGKYGENVPYTGTIPTYTAEEEGYVYYLFNRWDKSGFIDGEKTVEAIFDRFAYNATAFKNKELKDLSPVEIYAMNKLNLASNIITDKDPYTIVVGNDVEYDDIESELLISEKTHFNGTNHFDTGIQLFDKDKDFVLAIDYEFLEGNTLNSVLTQCFQSNGSNGFKLGYNSGVKFTWGTTSDSVSSVNKREIIVIRHKKGDNNITIYKSNLDGEEVLRTELTRNKLTTGTGTLVFGCARADDGFYENHAIGNINWAKVWFADLGEDVCRDLAMWTHESITLEACGFRKYYLTENTSKRCSFSLLASHLLGRTKMWNTSNVNDGGWASSALNASLNNRLYNAMPTQIKSLLKQVIVYSSDGLPTTDGGYYTEVIPANCYITIPALIEVDPTKTIEPYNSEGSAISYIVTNDDRKRAFDGGDYSAYWTRSPNASYANYVWSVDKSGAVQGITPTPNTNAGVLIEISF